jgi:hypothetical protein
MEWNLSTAFNLKSKSTFPTTYLHLWHLCRGESHDQESYRSKQSVTSLGFRHLGFKVPFQRLLTYTPYMQYCSVVGCI